MVANIIVVVLIVGMLVALFLRKKKLSELEDAPEEQVVEKKSKPKKEKINKKKDNPFKAMDKKEKEVKKETPPKKAKKHIEKVEETPVEEYMTVILDDEKTVMIDDDGKTLGGISLKLVKGFDNTIVYSDLVNKNITFGRSDDNDVIFQDKSVSKVHALVSIIDGNLWIKDNQSANGTKVNGIKISSDTIINDNDVIKLGRIELRAEIK